MSDSDVTLGFLTHVEQQGCLREGASRVPALAPMRPSTPGGRAPGGWPRRSSGAGGGVPGGLGRQAAGGAVVHARPPGDRSRNTGTVLTYPSILSQSSRAGLMTGLGT